MKSGSSQAAEVLPRLVSSRVARSSATPDEGAWEYQQGRVRSGGSLNGLVNESLVVRALVVVAASLACDATDDGASCEGPQAVRHKYEQCVTRTTAGPSGPAGADASPGG